MNENKFEDIEKIFLESWTLQSLIQAATTKIYDGFRSSAYEVGNHSGGLDLEKALVTFYSKPGSPSIAELEASKSEYVRATAVFMRARQKSVPIAEAFEQARQHIRRSPGGSEYKASRPNGSNWSTSTPHTPKR